MRSGSQSYHLNPYFFFFSYCNHPSEVTTMMECLWMLQLLLQSPHNRSRLDRVAFFFTQPRVLCLSLSTLLNRHATAQTRLASSSGTCNVKEKNTSEFYNHLCFSLSCNTSPLYTQWASFFLFQLGFDDELGTPFVNLKHHSNSSQDKTQLHWDQSLTSSSLITNVSSFITLDRIKTMSSSYLCKQPFSKY